MKSESRKNPESSTFDFCVLIPCYNNIPGLVQTLQSITYHAGQFCVLVVDDGSDVPVQVENLFSGSGNGFPVFTVLLEKNYGITYALNTGLQWIEDNLRVKYIARLDCGDLAQPDRFYKQVSYLEKNPETGLVGSWCFFREPQTGFQYSYTTPSGHPEIKKEMYFRNVFIHPTVMFRSALLKIVGYYPTAYPHVEDYAFFWQMLRHTQTAVLEDFLVTCEINPQGISIKNRQAQLSGRSKVIEDFGENRLLKGAGQLKLVMLKLMPYKLLLKLKPNKKRSLS
ncbi:glycosyltransferase [Adhaeribacter soli]|uniref:Glycosyltransferase n=1 Tax=Adhaeribacter soli TaxID=2607655 RepID=A0A5N1IYQ7_9BACT|nr:glycosyltransferase [Adhaeribacter soli]KAA9339027.1 glycosyltransferase [Adhaeribacter soli]